MKDLRRWIYAGLAAFVVGGVLGFLGFDNTTGGIAGIMVFTTVYTALQRMGGNRKIDVRDDAARAAALAVVPPPGHGLLYVYRTGFLARLLGIDIIVDGAAAGQLVSPRSLQLLLPAGRHEITAAQNGPGTQAAAPMIVTLAPNGVAVVEVQVATGLMKNILKLRLHDNAEAALQRLRTIPMIVAATA